MNDPGLHEPINNADSQVNNNVFGGENEKPGDMDEEEEERSSLVPARWWYASTAIPLVAGTFGPMANAFSVCALVENWRVRVPPGGTEEHGIDIKDPKWLIAVNAVSLVCALVANLSLLLNMARRVPFNIAQPITILGFWIASVLLIVLIAVAANDPWKTGIEHQALTQAYYYAIFAASLYQVISYLMCVTVWGAFKGHYSKEFKLTVAQRTLMLQTISFLVYQHLWALGYSHIEGWKFLDAVYWADFTSLTIGIGGDYVPRTHLGRSLLFPFALGGVVILGLVIGSIRSLVLERGKKKMSARVTEKTRKALVKQVKKNMEDDKAKRLKWRGMKKDMAIALTMAPEDETMAEKDRREYEFEAMRKVQEVAAQKRKYFSLFTSTFAFAFLWTIGAYVFYKAEKNQKWTYFESFYFAYTSLLTVGYGDLQPLSNSGKPFFVFWSLLAVPTLTILISNMGDTVVKGVKDVTIWLGEITVLPSDNASVMDRLKYGLYRSTLKRIEPQKKVQDAESADSESDGKEFQELHPGLAKVFGQRGRQKLSKKQKDAGDRIAKDFEQSEALDEQKAKDAGNEEAGDIHHYRRELLAQVRTVYADVNASKPKKYSYSEWAHFLKLIGEDEADSRFHKRTPAALKVKKDLSHDESVPTTAPGQLVTEGQEKQITQWSWLGQNSPLMEDEDEAEWILERLFRRLEQSLTGQLLEDGQPNHRKSSAVDSKHQNGGSDQDILQASPDKTTKQKEH